MFPQTLTIVLTLFSSINSLPSGPCSGVDKKLNTGNELTDEPGINLQLSFNKLAYITRLSIGTPPQAFTFNIGSRTQEFWVRSSNCTEYCDIEPKYNSSLSSTYKKDGRKVSATYGNIDGTMDGYLSSDTVSIGKGKIEDVLFGEITNVFGSFNEGTNISGVLGLGFKPNPPFEFFVDDLLQLTCIHKVGAFYLKRIKPDFDVPYLEDAGRLTIGSKFGDKSLYDGDITWIKGQETSDGDLILPMKGITAGDNIAVCEKGCSAIIDATSIMLGLPGSASFDINQGLGFTPWIGSGYLTQCSRMSSLPNVTFDFNGHKVSIPPADYLIEIANQGNLSEDEKVCFSIFYAVEGSEVVLGLQFLYNSYTLFDYDQKLFGFATFKPEAMKFAS